MFKFAGVDCTASDFEIDLDVNIRCSGMTKRTVGAEEFGYESADDNKLRSSAVMVHDSHQRGFSGAACLA